MKVSGRILFILLLTATFSYPQVITKLKMFGGVVLSYHNSSNGDLYAGTISGIWKLSSEGTEWERIRGLHNYRVNAIESFEQNSLLFAGTDKGLVKYDGTRWFYIAGLIDVEINALLKVVQTQLLIATGTGLYRYYTDTGDLVKLTDRIPEDVFYALYRDSQGRIWAGGAQGKVFQLEENGDFVSEEAICNNGDPCCFVEDKDGYIIAGTQGGGVYRKLDSYWEPFSNGIVMGWIFDLFRDASDVIFIASPAGVQTMNATGWSENIELPENTNAVTAFGNRNGKVVLGTDGNGHHTVDESTFITKELNLGFEAVSVNDIVETNGNILVACEGNGLLLSNPENPDEEAERIYSGMDHSSVRSLTKDPDGNVYGAAGKSVRNLGQAGAWDETSPQAHVNDWINNVDYDNGEVYVSSNDGVYEYSKEDNSASKVYDVPNATGVVRADNINSWIFASTYGFGIQMSFDGGENFDRDNSVEQDYFDRCYKCPDGSIWVFSKYEIRLKKSGGSEWEKYKDQRLNDIKKFSAFVPRRDGMFSAVTDQLTMLVYNSGYWREYELESYTTSGDTTHPYSPFPKRNIEETGINETVSVLKMTDNDDVYIVGTQGGGVYLVDISEQNTTTVSANTPAEFTLGQNYPNPFNPSTSIGYSIPVAAYVRLQIYNSNGERIRELVNERKSAGSYGVYWNGKNSSGQEVCTGVYFYRLQVGNSTKLKKMVLLK